MSVQLDGHEQLRTRLAAASERHKALSAALPSAYGRLLGRLDATQDAIVTRGDRAPSPAEWARCRELVAAIDAIEKDLDDTTNEMRGLVRALSEGDDR